MAGQQQGNKKMAVVVGCNHPTSEARLVGCHTDALSMRELLIARFGFADKDVEVMIDKPGSPTMPTGGNIKRALKGMVDKAKKGDVLFFHFSGHGGMRGPPELPKQEDVIFGSDFNMITSVDFRDIVNRVPTGATFTILADTCNSGGLIDKEKEQIGPSVGGTGPPARSQSTPRRMIPFKSVLEYLKAAAAAAAGSTSSSTTDDIGRLMVELFGEDASLMFRKNNDVAGPPLKADEGILLSGCQQNEESADIPYADPPHGAFSNAVQIIAREMDPKKLGFLTNRDIVLRARMIILELDEIDDQHPCLYCSDDNAAAAFLGQPPAAAAAAAPPPQTAAP